MPKSSEQGFSLIELMVALAFTAVLMAGMAGVYKSSITTFTTAGERLSAVRRGRVAIDVLSDDLNVAGMFLRTLTAPPSGAKALSTVNPGFWVNPDQAVTLTDGALRADEFYFYYDQPLPFEATLVPQNGAPADKGLMALENDFSQDLSQDTARTKFIDTKDPSFASMIQVGQFFYVKDQTAVKTIESIKSVSGNIVEVVVSDKNADAAGARTGNVGISLYNDRKDAPIMVVVPEQMVKYSIKARAVDPSDPSRTVPCLVREQGTYQSGAPGLPAASITNVNVLAEDVTGLKVYMSVDGGRTWIREDAGGGWSAYKTKVNAALALGYGRPEQQTIESATWFREIPVTIRVDVTTRTAAKRMEYGASTTATSYKERVSTFVLRPRHFGLSMPVTGKGA